MKSKFIAAGISHKTAPVKVRERYSFSKRRVSGSLNRLSRSGIIDGAVILCTCNRTEVYALTAFEGFAKIFLCAELGIPPEELRYFYFQKNENAVKHLFRVSAGLDSQVIGESQILGQVKDAYRRAKESGATGKYLDILFRKAIKAGGEVRRTTGISAGNVSIGSCALRMAEKLLGTLNGKKILIIGTGKTGEVAARYLLDRGISGVFVANRTFERARKLAGKLGGRAVGLDNLKNEIKDTDLIISATASPHLILRKEMIEDIMVFRTKPLCLMDLAVPRDIDPEIKKIGSVSLCSLDDLNLVIAENYRKREREAERAEYAVEAEVKKFWKCLRQERRIDYGLRSESASVPAAWL